MPSQIGELFKKIQKQLSPVSKELADRDAEKIIEHVRGINRSQMYTNLKYVVSEKDYNAILKLTEQRLTGIPLPYLLGYTYFYSKIFFVSQDVVIPRPDTETLIEMVLRNEADDNCNFIDMGTGSGIIADTLVDVRPSWHAIAADISFPALKIAKKNCSERVLLFCNDKLTALKSLPVFDFIVSNPPYISRIEMQKLDTSVSDYEPLIGLYGGEDGLDFYHYLAQNGKPFLKDNGRIYCEIGATQDKDVVKIFQSSGWVGIAIHNDLAGRPRIVMACKA
jgi:release factor glutamine methyltransferase